MGTGDYAPKTPSPLYRPLCKLQRYKRHARVRFELISFDLICYLVTKLERAICMTFVYVTERYKRLNIGRRNLDAS